MEDRFNFRYSAAENLCVLIDLENYIEVEFIPGKFNQTQTVTVLDDSKPDALRLARIMREMADWLVENHSDFL